MGAYRSGHLVPGTRDEALLGSADSGSAAQAIAECRAHLGPDRTDFMWISVVDPTKAECSLLEEIFNVEERQLQDAVSTQERAKVEVQGDHLFILLKVLEWKDATSDVETGQVACLVGPGFAISVRHRRGEDSRVAQQLLAESPDLVATGPLAVFWAVAQATTDNYLRVGEAIQSDIEEIEEQVFSDRPYEAADRIYRLNRENLEMRRAVRPLLPEAHTLARGDHPKVPEPLRPALRDVGDNILRASDLVDSYDSTLMTMLMASTARQDLQQNRDMRKISAWAAIIAVPTAIAGIYGMNFDEMPELHWAFGYPAVVIVMLTICGILYRGFRKSGWL